MGLKVTRIAGNEMDFNKADMDDTYITINFSGNHLNHWICHSSTSMITILFRLLGHILRARACLK